MWATGLARPPFVSTCSLWESSDATRAYAFAAGHAHNDAIAIGRAKPFHNREAFIRFRPYAVTGHLDGGNPLPESIAAQIATAHAVTQPKRANSPATRGARIVRAVTRLGQHDEVVAVDDLLR